MSLDTRQCSVLGQLHDPETAACTSCGRPVCFRHQQRRFPLSGIFCSAGCIDALAEQIILRRPVPPKFKLLGRARQALLMHSLPAWADPTAEIGEMALLSTSVLAIHIAGPNAACRLVYDPSVWTLNSDFARSLRADRALNGWQALNLEQVDVPFAPEDNFELLLERAWRYLSHRRGLAAKWFTTPEPVSPDIFKAVKIKQVAAPAATQPQRIIRVRVSK